MATAGNAYMKVRDVMRCLDITRPTVEKRIREGCFKAIKVGTATRIDRASFEKYLEGQEIKK